MAEQNIETVAREGMGSILRVKEMPPWFYEWEAFTDARGLTKKRKRVIKFPDEESHRRAMNEYYRNEYAGLSPLVKGDEIFQIDPPSWALENLVQEGGLTMIHGAPGSGKSLMALDWAYTLAHPEVEYWHGQKKTRTYKPLYLYTEGVPGLVVRTRSWEAERGFGMPGVYFQFTPLSLNRTENPEQPWSAQVAALRRQFDEGERDLLIIDTLANTFAGNENSQQDANNYMAALRMFQEGGVPIIVIHHDKREGKEYRGSSVFHGAFDTMVHTEKDGQLIKLSLTKQKDGDDSFRMAMRLKQVEWTADRWSVVLGDAPTTGEGFSPESEATVAVLEQAGEPITKEVVADRLGIPASTADKRLRNLLSLDVVVQTGSGKKGDPYRYAVTETVEEL